MSEEQPTAQVVLQPDPDAAALEDSAARAADWVRSQGFSPGPFVGISFAISGPEALFHEMFGDEPLLAAPPGYDVELPVAALAEEVQPLVAAVVRTARPDFGPGNP